MREQEIDAAIASLEQSSAERASELVATNHLPLQQTRHPIGVYIGEVWRYREFAYRYGMSRVNTDTDEMFLGRLWYFLEPVLRIAMYGLVFGLLLKTSRGIENFLGFLTLGIMFYGMFSKGINSGSGLLKKTRALSTTFNFPRATLVLGESIRNSLSNMIPALVAVLAALAFQNFENLGPAVILAIPLFVFINIFAAGLTFIVARVTAFVPDAKKIIFFINRALFYVSGVFFSVERYATQPEVQRVMEANPIYQFLEAIRGCVLYGTEPVASTWLSLSIWTFGCFSVGFLFFWRAEGRFENVK